MFKILTSRRRLAYELDASKLYDSDTFYQDFSKDLRKCKQELIIESPFLTKARVSSLAPVFRTLISKDIEIIVNTRPQSEQDIIMATQSEIAVNLLLGMGVKVLFTGGHHRKVAVIDRRILWEGSLNILSQRNSCEIMRRMDSSGLAEQMISYLKLREYLR